MATPFIDFRPAEVRKNKETYILYYVLDPASDKLKRMRIRCNRFKRPRERLKYANLLCAEINRKLYNGWNPLTGEESTSTKRASIVQDHHCHFFRIFATPKPQPMNYCRPYRFVHPLRGCGDTRGNALYRDASPNGDKGCNNQHLGARHVSTTPPPQCADATTTLHSSFSILNSSFSHTFSAKERDIETGLSYFGSRYYSSDLSIWLSVDPMSDKYPSLSPYVYCADNPVKLVDPNGEDPIYAKNFWGNVKKIGDNGQCESSSYLVLGDKVKEVKAATKSGKFYTGDLSPSDMVIHIPTGQIQQDIQLTVDQSLKSGNSPENRVEYGGHSLFGDKTARFWDPGTPTQTTTYNGVTIQKRTDVPLWFVQTIAECHSTMSAEHLFEYIMKILKKWEDRRIYNEKV